MRKTLVAVLLAGQPWAPSCSPLRRARKLDYGAEAGFVSATNSLRAGRGLAPLAVSGELTAKARAWAQVMADAGKWQPLEAFGRGFECVESPRRERRGRPHGDDDPRRPAWRHRPRYSEPRRSGVPVRRSGRREHQRDPLGLRGVHGTSLPARPSGATRCGRNPRVRPHPPRWSPPPNHRPRFHCRRPGSAPTSTASAIWKPPDRRRSAGRHRVTARGGAANCTAAAPRIAASKISR